MAILSNLVRELEEENDRLTAELAEAKKDTERLDFLDETNQSFFWPEDQSVRAAIDAGRGE
jgi:hypothetical protein